MHAARSTTDHPQTQYLKHRWVGCGLLLRRRTQKKRELGTLPPNPSSELSCETRETGALSDPGASAVVAFHCCKGKKEGSRAPKKTETVQRTQNRAVELKLWIWKGSSGVRSVQRK